MVTQGTNDAELHDILTGMMAPLDDGHVSLFAPNEPFWNGHQEFREPTASGAFSGDLLLNGYLGGDFQNYEDQIFYGRVHPEIGYMFINHFRGKDLTVIDEILAGMQGVSGVIIDLRRNAGGDFTNALTLISRFADQKRLAFSAIPKNGPGRNDFADPVDYFVEPGGSSRFAGKVVVLTDRYTLSAGESAVLFLRVLPTVTVIGEATSGAMGERIEKELPNGWIYSITGQRIVAADGMNYEGPGVPPDIEANNTSAQISSGVDHILDVAIDTILN
jgi:carboxyl-terminal processing protease